jgi:MFS family permease
MTDEPFKPTRGTFVFLMLSAMMILMGGAAIAPALPLISAAFPDAPEAMISLIITLPALAIAITGFFIGALSDRIGKIRVLAASVAIFSIAGSSGFCLTSLPAILVARFILGIGIAGIICTTSALIISYYDGYTRAKILGYQAASMGLGVLILETSGGFLAGISWRAAFLIYLIGVVILVGVLTTMKEPARPKLADVSAVESEAGFPTVPLLLIYATVFLGNMLFFMVPSRLPYLVANMDAARLISENTALLSGIFLGISGIASTVIGIFYGRFAGRFNKNTLLVFCFVSFGIGLFTLGVAGSLTLAAFAVIMIGIGEGILMPTILTGIAAVTPRRFLGRASGGFSVALNLGQFASSIALMAVLDAVATDSHLFLFFGCVGFVFAVPYILAIIREKYTVPCVEQKVEAGAR